MDRRDRLANTVIVPMMPPSHPTYLYPYLAPHLDHTPTPILNRILTSYLAPHLDAYLAPHLNRILMGAFRSPIAVFLKNSPAQG